MSKILVLFSAASFALAAGSDAAKKAEATQCLACHSTRIIHSQRLSSAAWGRELDKMIGWGAMVSDKQLLIDYLTAEYGNDKPVPPPAMSEGGMNR